jgi:ArsR family transcriptional regulator
LKYGKPNVVKALVALGQETRLAVFRYLIPQGPEGVPAGDLSAALGVLPNALSFHLNRLESAGLIRARREGRFMFYAANYQDIQDLLGFLTEDCCGNVPEGCSSSRSKSQPKRFTCGGTKKSSRRRAAAKPRRRTTVKTGG